MSATVRFAVLLAALVTAGTAAAEETQQPYRDWALSCPGQSPCRLEQQVFVEGAGDRPLVQVLFQARDEFGAPLLVLQVPLGVLLPTGLRLRVDQGSPVAIPFHHCRAEGCLALTPLRPELRRPLELGRKASLEFTTLDDRRLGVPVSLMGITDGLRALDQSARGGGGATRE